MSDDPGQPGFVPTWKTMPEEMMGVIPNSISVPLLLANIIRSQYIGSELSEETMPYSGI